MGDFYYASLYIGTIHNLICFFFVFMHFLLFLDISFFFFLYIPLRFDGLINYCMRGLWRRLIILRGYMQHLFVLVVPLIVHRTIQIAFYIPELLWYIKTALLPYLIPLPRKKKGNHGYTYDRIRRHKESASNWCWDKSVESVLVKLM